MKPCDACLCKKKGSGMVCEICHALEKERAIEEFNAKIEWKGLGPLAAPGILYR